MIVGVPKEIKNQEFRVALTPAGVAELVKYNHQVWVETNAGEGSGFTDDMYLLEGAKICASAAEVFTNSQLIIKVKEPLESEYQFIQKDQIIFTYLHLAASLSLTEALIKSGSICIAYETVEKSNKSLPLLAPMSEVAGRMSIQVGARFLEKPQGGRGVLLGGVPGVSPANVLILGAGIVGTNAARMAAGLGAHVTLMDVNMERLRQLSEWMPANVTTIVSNDYNIKTALVTADLVIGAVLIPGGKAPVLIKKEMLKMMKPGAVIIDVAVDQGGCIETCRPTTHDAPVFILDGIIHYGVSNMPGAVPYTSTLALTSATLPYILQLANKGWGNACEENDELAKGLNIVRGKITSQAVAVAFGLPWDKWSV